MSRQGDRTRPRPNASHRVTTKPGILPHSLYGGPPEYTDFPKQGQFAFTMCRFLCRLQSRGEVKLKTTKARNNPIADRKYLSDKLDLLMMSEGVRFANEIVTTSEGTKDLIKSACPPGAQHHLNKTNEDW